MAYNLVYLKLGTTAIPNINMHRRLEKLVSLQITYGCACMVLRTMGSKLCQGQLKALIIEIFYDAGKFSIVRKSNKRHDMRTKKLFTM